MRNTIHLGIYFVGATKNRKAHTRKEHNIGTYKSGTKMIFAPPPDMGGHKIFAPPDGVDTTFSHLSDTPLHDIFRLGGV